MESSSWIQQLIFREALLVHGREKKPVSVMLSQKGFPLPAGFKEGTHGLRNVLGRHPPMVSQHG